MLTVLCTIAILACARSSRAQRLRRDPSGRDKLATCFRRFATRHFRPASSDGGSSSCGCRAHSLGLSTLFRRAPPGARWRSGLYPAARSSCVDTSFTSRRVVVANKKIIIGVARLVVTLSGGGTRVVAPFDGAGVTSRLSVRAISSCGVRIWQIRLNGSSTLAPTVGARRRPRGHEGDRVPVGVSMQMIRGLSTRFESG